MFLSLVSLALSEAGSLGLGFSKGATTIKDSKRCSTLLNSRILKWIQNSEYHQQRTHPPTNLITQNSSAQKSGNVFPNRFAVVLAATHAIIRVQGIPEPLCCSNCAPFESSVAPSEQNLKPTCLPPPLLREHSPAEQ